jgi:hypothetical protein
VALYALLAHMANVRGVVHVRVTTDGQRAVATRVEDGHKLLAAAAEQNPRTWVFAMQGPTTLTITYPCRLDRRLERKHYDPTVVLRLATDVGISITPVRPLDTVGRRAAWEGHHV